jgi:hypothetical protein
VPPPSEIDALRAPAIEAVFAQFRSQLVAGEQHALPATQPACIIAYWMHKSATELCSKACSTNFSDVGLPANIP